MSQVIKRVCPASKQLSQEESSSHAKKSKQKANGQKANEQNSNKTKKILAVPYLKGWCLCSRYTSLYPDVMIEILLIKA
jgi:hypothetical protein